MKVFFVQNQRRHPPHPSRHALQRKKNLIYGNIKKGSSQKLVPNIFLSIPGNSTSLHLPLTTLGDQDQDNAQNGAQNCLQQCPVQGSVFNNNPIEFEFGNI